MNWIKNIWPWWLSGIVILLAIGVFIGANNTETAAQIGDFFAGFSAALAFIWLIAGFIQQRMELVLQRQELTLQREELKLTREEMANHVEEAKQLVEQTGLQREIMERDFGIRHEPLFICETLTSSAGASKSTAHMSIINVGGIAIYLNAQGKGCEEITINPSSHAETGKEVAIYIKYDGNLKNGTASLDFSYRNRFGVESSYRCWFGKDQKKEELFSEKLK